MTLQSENSDHHPCIQLPPPKLSQGWQPLKMMKSQAQAISLAFPIASVAQQPLGLPLGSTALLVLLPRSTTVIPAQEEAPHKSSSTVTPSSGALGFM